MVAITVVLAGIIGAFALGFSGEIGDTPPQARFDFDFDTSAQTVTITHDGGDEIDGSNLNVSAAGNTTAWGGSDPVTAGGTWAGMDYDGLGATSGDTMRVVWQSPSGGDTQTIARAEIP